jgi:hypothetical protein
MSKDLNHYSLCFLSFFYFVEHHPTAFGLTSEKHRGWMYVEFLKLGRICFLCIFHPRSRNHRPCLLSMPDMSRRAPILQHCLHQHNRLLDTSVISSHRLCSYRYG